MYELGYCSLLLLLCERKLMTFSKGNTRFEYDVFSGASKLRRLQNARATCGFLRVDCARILQDAKTFLRLEVKTAKTSLR